MVNSERQVHARGGLSWLNRKRKRLFTLNELNDAYKRLKAQAVFDRSGFSLKKTIAEFEVERKHSSPSSRIFDLHTSANNDWNSLIRDLASQVVIDVKPKDVRPAMSGYISNAPEANVRIEKYAYHAVFPIELQIIDVAWVVKYGKAIDNDLIPRSLGNRVSAQPNSTFIFRPYFKQYKKWRDGAIQAAKHRHSRESVAIISFDLRQFYHTVNAESKTITDCIENNSGNYLKTVWRYHKAALNEFTSTEWLSLPIGLSSSALLANIALNSYDKLASKTHSLYYARYVDDIIMVVETPEGTSKEHFLSRIETIKSNAEGFYIESNNQTLSFSAEKTKIFFLDKEYPSTPIDEYIDRLSEINSEWRFIAEVDPADFDVAKAATEIDSFGSIVAPRGIEDIGLSKHVLSKRLNNIIYCLSIVTVVPKKDKVKLTSSLIYAFSGSRAVAFFELWEKAFTALYLAGEFDGVILLARSIVAVINKSSSDQIESIRECKTFLYAYLNMSITLAICNSGKKIKKAHASEIETTLDIQPGKKFTNQRLYLYLEKSGMHRSYLTTKPFFIEAGAARSKQQLHSKYDMYMKLIEENAIASTTYNLDPLVHIKDYESEVICDEGDIEAILMDSQNAKLTVGITNFNHIDGRIKASLKKPMGVDLKQYNTFARLINEAIKGDCSILAFPELSIPEELFGLLAYTAKKQRMIIVGGLEYIRINNVPGNFSFALLPFKDGFKKDVRPILRAKTHYAKSESDLFADMGISTHWTSRANYVVRYKNISFTVFNCFELADIRMRDQVKGEIDLLVAIEYNRDLPYFSNIIESAVRDLHCFVVQANAGEYGDSRVVAPLSSQVMNICRIKGGKNNYLVLQKLDVQSLRKIQDNPEADVRMYGIHEIKRPPPGFKRNSTRDNR
jgi:hypothetical protein